MESFGGYAGAVAAIMVAIIGALVRWLVLWIRAQVAIAKSAIENHVADKIDETKRQFGETVRAVQQKTIDMELWNRDNLVNRRVFDGEMANTRDTLLRLEDKIDARFDRLDAKLSKFSHDDEP